MPHTRNHHAFGARDGSIHLVSSLLRHKGFLLPNRNQQRDMHPLRQLNSRHLSAKVLKRRWFDGSHAFKYQMMIALWDVRLEEDKISQLVRAKKTHHRIDVGKNWVQTYRRSTGQRRARRPVDSLVAADALALSIPVAQWDHERHAQ